MQDDNSYRMIILYSLHVMAFFPRVDFCRQSQYYSSAVVQLLHSSPTL